MKKERIISFPRVGKYTEVFKNFLESLGLYVLNPPPITERTIKLGVKNSPDMMCYPFKVVLGNFIEEVEKGANCLIMYDSMGKCRLRHYWILHRLILKNLGYDFEIFPLRLISLFKLIRQLNPQITYLEILRQLRKGWFKLKAIEEKHLVKGNNRLKIGIVGEIYTCLEPAINFNIDERLKGYGVQVYNTIKLSDFIKSSLRLDFLEKRAWRRFRKEASAYLNGPLGGHGFENIYNALYLCEKGIHGLIHLLPLSCMPETTIEPILNDICTRYNVPLLRLMIDETNSEVNFETRIETFVELIKRRERWKGRI